MKRAVMFALVLFGCIGASCIAILLSMWIEAVKISNRKSQ
jgi:hypothetical protein